jgi:hypothetical protein
LNVPHVYFLGVKTFDVPLSLSEMSDDINAEHAEKTATYEDHAFLTRKFLLIRPSQHGNVMLKLVESLESARRSCTPWDLFLNFIHTVVPTIGISTPGRQHPLAPDSRAAPRNPPMLKPAAPSAKTKKAPTKASHPGAPDPRAAAPSPPRAPLPRVYHCRVRPPGSPR